MINELAAHDGISRRIIEAEYTVKDYIEMVALENRKIVE